MRLLADCYRPPAPGVGRMVAELEFLVSLWHPRSAPHAAAMLADCGDPEEMLKVYARLFLGPFSLLAPPYGSVYLDPGRTVMGPSTRAVAALYQQEGLDLAPGFNEAPDHITVELEFLHYLLARRAEAQAGGDAGAAQAWAEKASRFLAGHLGRWLGEFCWLMRKEAGGGFYAELADLTISLVRAEWNLPHSRGRGSATGP